MKKSLPDAFLRRVSFHYIRFLDAQNIRSKWFRFTFPNLQPKLLNVLSATEVFFRGGGGIA